MGALAEAQSLEAEIMDCCRAIYWATDPDIAMSNWVRLRTPMCRERQRSANSLSASR